MSDIENDVEEMRCVLSAIADEIQKYDNDASYLNSTTKIDNVLGELLKYKRTLKSKREEIKLLRRNLKTTCFVAKALSAAKENESATLNNQLINIRNQCWNLVKQEKEKNNLVSILRAENQTLRDKLEIFNNFIKLGYKELQNQREDYSEDDITILAQLQKIILYCGHCHADYQNQTEKCLLLEQNNRFLNTKIIILESNLKATSEKLRSYRHIGGIKRVAKRKDKSESQVCGNLGVISSEYKMGHHRSVTNLKMIKIELSKESLLENFKGLDLSYHFNTVKKLLKDQDILIKDLKCITNELNLETFLE